MLKNSLSDMSLPRDKFIGIYRAVVEDNNDPLQAGRIQARVFGIHSQLKTKTAADGIPTAELPWAEPAIGLLEGGLTEQGMFGVPLVNSHVFIFFENGNPMRPIYFASVPSGNNDWYNGTTGTYPHNIAFKSHGGHIVEVDSTPDAKRYKIHHPSGTVIDVDNEGNVDITIVANETRTININRTTTITGDDATTVSGKSDETITGNKTIITSANMVITASGACEIKSTGNTTVIAPSIMLGGNSGTEKLMNETAMGIYNTHTHNGGNTPDQQMVADSSTTSITSAK